MMMMAIIIINAVVPVGLFTVRFEETYETVCAVIIVMVLSVRPIDVMILSCLHVTESVIIVFPVPISDKHDGCT